MTSLSEPISSYLHNDPIDLNSPKFQLPASSFPSCPGLLGHCSLLLMSSSRWSEVTAYQRGLTLVLWMGILPGHSVPSPPSAVPKERRGGSPAFKSLCKLSATGMLFLGAFSCLNHQLFPPPLPLLCWAMTHLDTSHTTNNYQDPWFIPDRFLPPLPASPD